MSAIKKILTLGAALALVILPFVHSGVVFAAGWQVTNDTLISANAAGDPGNQSSFTPYMTTDGRFVGFESSADNLVPGGPGGPPFTRQSYVYDRQTSTMELVSRNTNGDTANNLTGVRAISDDGRFVLLHSAATNMDNYDPGVNNGALYIRDRQNNTTQLVGPRTQQSYADFHPMSADGTFILYTGFDTSNNATLDIYNRLTGQTTNILAFNANVAAGIGSISDDGQIVNYRYLNGGTTTAYKYVVATHQTTTTISSTGIGDVSFSPDGTLMAYFLLESGISNLYVKNIATGQTSLIYSSTGELSGGTDTTFSTDNHFLSFPVKTANTPSRGQSELWIADLTTGHQLLAKPTAHHNGFAKLNADGTQLLYTTNDGDQALRQTRVVDISLPSSDTVAPTLGTPTWTVNPKSVSQPTTLTVPVTDDTAVTGGEYFIGDTDPGQGQGTAMTVGLNNLTATFGTNIQTGVYKINVRAVDAAGNWSTVTSDYLVVYDPTGFRMTGKRSIVPSLSNGDILPGLTATGQTDTATFAFNVKYNSTGQINQNSDLQFSYKTGTHCNTNHPANCHNLSLNATSIAWLTTQGTNNSTGIFQGTATLTVDSATSQVVFRVTGVDGSRLNTSANDQFQLHIWSVTSNPDTATPLYRVNSAAIAHGNIKIL